MDRDWDGMQLADIRLRSILRFDPINKTFEQSRSLKYFRLPLDSEYPLDLRRGYGEFVHREGVFPGPFDQVQHYLMRVEPTKQMLQETDFILHRHTLKLFTEAKSVDTFTKEYRFEAFRLKGCIFVKLAEDELEEVRMRDFFAFKARQYLLSERPGEAPDTDTPIDGRMQQYGVFTARVGQFRLLYTGELTGLSNTDPLGDLTDQEELDKCCLAHIRVVKQQIAWRNTFRYGSWVRQAYLAGVKQLVVASFDDYNGQVVKPIEVEPMETLLQKPGLDIGRRVKRIHEFLERISAKLEVDSPAMSVKFQLIGEALVFEKAFDTEFIDYAVKAVITLIDARPVDGGGCA